MLRCRDICCYLTAAIWLYIVLWDGDITLYESVGFIAVYVGYVILSGARLPCTILPQY